MDYFCNITAQKRDKSGEMSCIRRRGIIDDMHAIVADRRSCLCSYPFCEIVSSM